MSEQQSPYQAPSSTLVQEDNSEWGSIDKALSGNYELSVGGVISEAWALTKGVKRKFWLAFFVYLLVVMAVAFALSMVLKILGLSGMAMVVGSILNQLILMVVMYPLIAGIFLMGIRHASGQPISIDLLFNNWGKVVPLLVSYLLMTVFIIIGFLLLVLPGIYLAIAYVMTMPLIVERNLGAWEALELSRKAVTKKWFQVFVIMLLLAVGMMVSALPLGIGLIWTVPLSVLIFAVIYRNMFGVIRVQ